MRVADEERSYLLFDAEVDDRSDRLVSQVGSSAVLVRGSHCSFFQRRECLVQWLCFLASRPNCLLCCRLSERMPRPVTIVTRPVLVVTAEPRWRCTSKGLLAVLACESLLDMPHFVSIT